MRQLIALLVVCLAACTSLTERVVYPPIYMKRGEIARYEYSYVERIQCAGLLYVERHTRAKYERVLVRCL